MTPAKFAREVVYPLVTPAVLLSLIALFVAAQIGWSLVSLFLITVRPLGWILLILFLIFLLPVTSRYLMEVLDARIESRPPNPLGIDLLGRFGFSWSFFPLALIFAMGWVVFQVDQRIGAPAAWVANIGLSLLLPASLSVLAMTNSAISALNPVSLFRLIRLCGARYLLVPAASVTTSMALMLLQPALPDLVFQFGLLIVVALIFSMTGAVVSASGALKHVGIAEPVQASEEMRDEATERERTRILGHAYALLSRGNRAGGLEHIQTFVNGSASPAEEYRWFFDSMMRWEQPEHGLWFGQRYLSHLLAEGESQAALKLISRCLYVNPAFKPLPEDRPRALALAETENREDLIPALRG